MFTESKHECMSTLKRDWCSQKVLIKSEHERMSALYIYVITHDIKRYRMTWFEILFGYIIYIWLSRALMSACAAITKWIEAHWRNNHLWTINICVCKHYEIWYHNFILWGTPIFVSSLHIWYLLITNTIHSRRCVIKLWSNC